MAERSWIIERDGIAAADTAEWGRIAERDDVVEWARIVGRDGLAEWDGIVAADTAEQNGIAK